MKKLLTLLLATLFSLLISTAATAQISAGAGLAYGTEVEEIGIQVGAVYTITDDIRAGADFIYYFTEDGIDYWEFNVNGHYLFMDEEDMNIYALAGLNYTTIEIDLGPFGSASNSEAGLNIGAGLEYNLGFALLAAEVKYILSDFDQVVISAGLRFPF